jgi:tetratricopeptide (TPR) repeat protein
MLRMKDPRFLAILILMVDVASVPAQELTLKRTLPEVTWTGCPATGERIGNVTAAERQEGERLAESATRAALLGDKAAALDSLTRAADRDPSSRNIAYYHARILDELNRKKDALAAYCRYLALAPDAPDADEVRERTRVLGSPTGFAVPAAAAVAFESGLRQYNARRLSEAEAEFGRAMEAAPEWSDPLYNRAVIRIALGRRDDAASDLRSFIDKNPGSPGLDQLHTVLATLAAPTPATLNPNAALMRGLIVPGLGHFTTGRPVVGVLVLGVASGTLMAGVLTTRLDVECLGPWVNGECPSEDIAGQHKSRPYLLPAIAVAVGTAAFGAIDAYRGANARNARAAQRRVDPDGQARGPTLLPPSVNLGRHSAQFDLIRVRF